MKIKNYIGTSGYGYSHWKGIFYPEKLPYREFFSYYTEFFDTVELNNTFYHTPRESSIEKWYKSSPPHFIFSIKANKSITHIKRLKNAENSLKLFEGRIASLKEKIGVILFQLPPSFKKDIAVLKDFLAMLDLKWKYTFEFRHKSWFTDETYSLLKEKNVALCISDTPRYPYDETITANYTYIRLHGHKVLYASNYSNEVLQKYAEKIKKWNEKGITAYVYFDNDYYGYAVKNALYLKKILEER